MADPEPTESRPLSDRDRTVRRRVAHVRAGLPGPFLGHRQWRKQHLPALRASNPAIDGHVSNYAVTAAPVALLPAQAQQAAGQGAELVTVLIGANDACVPFQSNATPTPLPAFASQFRQAMNILSAAPSHPRILVASIPDLYQLWQLFHTDPNAVSVWSNERLCPPLFNNAASTAPADVARRAAFRLLLAAYNLVEEEICRRTPRCQTDGAALFRTQLTPADIATLTNTGGIVFPPPAEPIPLFRRLPSPVDRRPE